IYVYNQGRKNYVINFIQLTQRDGSFLVGREKIENFTFDMLKGKSILGGRKGGVPVMTLQYVLRQKGLDAVLDDPTKEVNIRTDVQYGVLAGAFVSGEGDFVTLFEPGATNLEKEGKGYVLASIGAESGNIPYTAYSATKSYIEKNPDIIQKFTNAIYKGQKWVQEHSAREIAELIHPYFKETPIEDLTIVMQRYKDIDAWCPTPFFAKEGLERLMDIMEQAGELTKRAPFEKIVDNSFANKAMQN
ncbi:MAG TPA: ABC transporter substrate-binding protein, partial [Bacilli bacterium]|nr:ABC transporter substrate-binding protein [Bacilli bacterium]